MNTAWTEYPPSATNSSHYTRHDMSGWWKCCSCRNQNNPALTSDYCSSCPHRRCDSCEPFSWKSRDCKGGLALWWPLPLTRCFVSTIARWPRVPIPFSNSTKDFLGSVPSVAAIFYLAFSIFGSFATHARVYLLARLYFLLEMLFFLPFHVSGLFYIDFPDFSAEFSA